MSRTTSLKTHGAIDMASMDIWKLRLVITFAVSPKELVLWLYDLSLQINSINFWNFIKFNFILNLSRLVSHMFLFLLNKVLQNYKIIQINYLKAVKVFITPQIFLNSLPKSSFKMMSSPLFYHVEQFSRASRYASFQLSTLGCKSVELRTLKGWINRWKLCSGH